MAASNEAWNWVIGRYDQGNPAALKRLLSGGAQLRAFPQDIMEACYKTANEIYADLSKSNPMFKKLYDSLVPFRSDSYLWMQVAEGSFDNFMIRMRTRT
jgi:TRAP-type mannitol/chloroaromatic compound transport system substrate-binding protein